MALHGLTRILGISVLLVLVVVVTTLNAPKFVDPLNLYNLLRWTALFGVLGVGVAFVIITGGIDLSIGSVVALSGVTLMILLQVDYYDSGNTLTVSAVDKDSKSIRFVEPLPEYHDLDQLVIAVPDGADDILLTIDADLTSKLGEEKVLVVRSNVQRVPIGAVTSLQYQDRVMHPLLAVPITLVMGIGIGLLHGVLIGYARLQPFIVTLCGLMAYRGLARLMAGDEAVGIIPHHASLRYLAGGKPFEVPVPMINQISGGGAGADAAAQDGFWGWVALPMPMLILLVIAVISVLLLHKSVPGRYMLAMGRNAEAARFSGISTRRMTLLAYTLCAGLATLGGMLFALDIGSVTPASDGNFYELYAIAAAVLGGCSLRGGVGSIAGVIIGTAVMCSLNNAINLLKYPSYWELIIIGTVLLIGVMIDELGRRVVDYFKTRKRRGQLSQRDTQ